MSHVHPGRAARIAALSASAFLPKLPANGTILTPRWA